MSHVYLPLLEKIELLQGNEAFFENKIIDGNCFYRKFEADLSNKVTAFDGKVISGLMPVKKWLDEAEFSRRWIRNHRCKRNLAVVEVEQGLITSLVDLFDRRLGRRPGQWRSTFNVCKHNNIMLLMNSHGFDEVTAKQYALSHKWRPLGRLIFNFYMQMALVWVLCKINTKAI